MSLAQKKILDYTLNKLIGEGGMAEIWLATNSIGTQVAVKVLFSKFCEDVSVLSRFEQEARIMFNLKHKNIREVYDIDNVASRPAIIMEYLEGWDFSEILKSKITLSEDQLVSFWNNCVEGLRYIHNMNIIHRDIKPSNLFFTKKGEVKLLDFGISKDNNNKLNLTLTRQVFGTRWYMSPEQIRSTKHVNKYSDIYSLAITFVHLLSGKPPYGADKLNDYDLQIKIVEKPLELIGLTENWKSFLQPYLEKEAEHREKLKLFSNFSSEKTILIDNPKSETELWKECKLKNKIEIYKSYLSQYPKGEHVADAQNEIGDIYYFGKNGIPKNYLKSFSWFKESSFHGNLYAKYSLGYMHKLGQGVALDYKKALICFQIAAEKGYLTAQCELANMYKSGQGVSQDYTTAYKWYQKAAIQGNLSAQFELGNMYEKGRGVIQNYHSAIWWFKKAANKGYEEAQFHLGDIYYYGHGVFKQHTKAIRWYRESAEQGYAPAQEKLGDLYYNGDHILRDNYKALRWYQKAAEQGNSSAQFKLGRMYNKGDRVSKDFKEAMKWLKKAAKQGNLAAIEMLKLTK
jgi:TPR repeat protein/tRNA A-37 threonylcarbamoyl transferase component Bud32